MPFPIFAEPYSVLEPFCWRSDLADYLHTMNLAILHVILFKRSENIRGCENSVTETA